MSACYRETASVQCDISVWPLEQLREAQVSAATRFGRCRVGDSFCVKYQYMCGVCSFHVAVWYFMSSLLMPCILHATESDDETLQDQGQSLNPII